MTPTPAFRRAGWLVLVYDNHEDGERDQQDGKEKVKERARHDVGQRNAQDAAGKRGQCKRNARMQVDTSLSGVGDRTGGRVHRNDRKRDRGDRARGQVGFEKRQERYEQEAATRPDQSAKRSDADADHDELEAGHLRIVGSESRRLH